MSDRFRQFRRHSTKARATSAGTSPHFLCSAAFFASPMPRRQKSSRRQRASRRLCCKKGSFLQASDRRSMATPNWRRASRARSRRLGAICPPHSFVIPLRRRDGWARVRTYCRKARGSGRCMNDGLILSLWSATAETTVAWGPPFSPASTPLLAIANTFAVSVGGCPTLSSGRALCCGCFPIRDPIGNDKAKEKHAAVTLGRLLRGTESCTAGDATLLSALHLRPLWARRKKSLTGASLYNSIRRWHS